MNHILITSEFYFPKRGGIEQYLRGLVRWISSNGIKVTVLTSKWDNTLPNFVEMDGGLIYYSDLLTGSLENPFSVIKNVKKISKFIDDLNPDLVYANNHNSLAVIRACRKSNKKVFYGCHGAGLMCALKKRLIRSDDSLCWDGLGLLNCTKCFFQGYKWERHPLKSFLHIFLTILPKFLRYKGAMKELERADGRIGNSNLCASLFKVKENTVGLHLPVELEGKLGYYCNIDNNLLAKYNLIHKDYIFVPGRLNNIKGQKYAVESLKYLRSDIKIVLAGNANLLEEDAENLGQYTQEVIKVIKENHLEDRVVFTGLLNGEEMRSLYSSARVTVIPSIWIETFGYVVIESLACETPVVVTKNCGAAECIDEEFGRVIARKSSLEISNAVEEIWDNAIVMGRKGREFLKNSHNWNTIGKKTLHFFYDLE